MEKITNLQKLIILIGVLILILLGIIFWNQVSKKKNQDTTPPAKDERLVIAENFAKEFYTFEEKNPQDYENRLKPYIVEYYWEDFIDYYALNPEREDNYSQVKEITGSQLLSEYADSSTVEATVLRKYFNSPITTQEQEETSSIMIILEKSDNKWFVSKVTYN